MSYAENTTVTIDRSKTEIERILARYGATGFMYGISNDKALVMFEAHKRRVKFLLPMPSIDDEGDTKGQNPERRCSG